jgi:hypothetical protein
MVARGPGAVGCAHCTKLGAVVACGVCKHLVCEACANDWSTCDQPWGRMFRLGNTARLVDVDPTARLALVSRWLGPMRYVDLRALRWVEDGEVPPLVRGRDLRPRLTSDGRMLQHAWVFGSEYTPPYRGLAVSAVAPKRTHLETRTPEPARGTGMSLRDDRYWYVTATEQVAIVRTAAATLPGNATTVAVGPIDAVARLEVASYDPLPRKVIQCAFIDDARDLLVAASWGEIIVHRIVGDKLDQTCYLKTSGDVVWVAIAGPYLAAHVKGGPERGITVWKLDARLAITGVALRVEDKVAIAALSRDGRYLVVGLTDDLVRLHGLDDGSVTTFDEHTDDVSYVGFLGDDQLLVTADDDNRVIIRPRTSGGYAQALMETTLASD